MNAVDHAVVIVYLVMLLGVGLFFRRQSSQHDYFLGGRSLNWFPLTLSVMATQLSAVSFISAPAFVGLREGGGLMWLTYESAVPLAMILVMFVIAPVLYKSGGISIYGFLGKRFGVSTRLLVSIFYQLSRAFGTGLLVYAVGIILEAVVGIPYWQSLIVVAVITLVYSTSGGMRAVVVGDVIQICLIVGGLLLIVYYAISDIGGFGRFWELVEPSRMQTVNFRSFGIDGDEFGFLPMIFGGFVLYTSYYGCDQSQAQRALSAKNMGDVRRMLLANGVLRFPLVALYCFAGLIIGVAVSSDAALSAKIPAQTPDYMMPVYIVERLPHGAIGLLFVAILSAAMSSLSSGLNSLSALTMRDVAMLGLNPKDARQEVVIARLVSVFWGLIMIALSSFTGGIAPTIIEAVNKIGSALFGPVLGLFLLAIFSRRVGTAGVNTGLILGLLCSLYLWRFQPQIFWMWWNLIGVLVTVGVAAAVTVFTARPPSRQAPLAWRSAFDGDDTPPRNVIVRTSVALAAYFFLIVAITVLIGQMK